MVKKEKVDSLNGKKEVEMTEEEKKLAADVLAKRKQLNSMRDDMRADIQKNLEIDEKQVINEFI